jgi:hypothetical protein
MRPEPGTVNPLFSHLKHTGKHRCNQCFGKSFYGLNISKTCVFKVVKIPDNKVLNK